MDNFNNSCDVACLKFMSPCDKTTGCLRTRTLGYIVLYCMFVYCIVLLSVVFYFNAFFLLAVNFVIFSLRATILINLNLNLNHPLFDGRKTTSI